MDTSTTFTSKDSGILRLNHPDRTQVPQMWQLFKGSDYVHQVTVVRTLRDETPRSFGRLFYRFKTKLCKLFLNLQSFCRYGSHYIIKNGVKDISSLNSPILNLMIKVSKLVSVQLNSFTKFLRYSSLDIHILVSFRLLFWNLSFSPTICKT